MNVRSYLSIKYGVDRPTVVSKREAKLFGIPYPLRPGWLDVFGNRELTQTMIAELSILLRSRSSTAKSERARRYANKGCSVLKAAEREAQWAPEPSNANDASFLQSYEWRRVRMQAIKLYGAKCQCCGAGPKDARLHIDHIKPRKLFPQFALDVKNLQILCEECNHGKGNWDMTDWRGDESEVAK